MVLDALLRELALNLLGRTLGVGHRDLVFVDPRCGFFEEVAARTTEDRGCPVDPAILGREDKGRGIGSSAGSGEVEDGGETEREKVVVPFV